MTTTQLQNVPSLFHLSIQTVAYWISHVEDLSFLPFEPFGRALIAEIENPTYPHLQARSTYLSPHAFRLITSAYGVATRCTDTTPAFSPVLPATLGALYFRRGALTLARLQRLRSLSDHLTHLDLAHVRPGVDDSICASVLSNLCHLVTLVLSGNGKITNTGMSHLVRPLCAKEQKGLICLQRLFLDGCFGVGDAGVVKHLTKLPQLQILDISNTGASASAAGMLLEQNHGFEKLDQTEKIELCGERMKSGLWRMLMESEPSCVNMLKEAETLNLVDTGELYEMSQSRMIYVRYDIKNRSLPLSNPKNKIKNTTVAPEVARRRPTLKRTSYNNAATLGDMYISHSSTKKAKPFQPRSSKLLSALHPSDVIELHPPSPKPRSTHLPFFTNLQNR